MQTNEITNTNLVTHVPPVSINSAQKSKGELEKLLNENTPILSQELDQLLEYFPQHPKVLLCTAIRKEKVEAVVAIIQGRYQSVVPSLYFAHHFIYEKCGNLYSELTKKRIDLGGIGDKLIQALEQEGVFRETQEKTITDFSQFLEKDIPFGETVLMQLTTDFPDHKRVILCNAIHKESVDKVVEVIQTEYEGKVPSLHFASLFINKKCGHLYSGLMAKYIAAFSQKQQDIIELYGNIADALQKEGAITTSAVYAKRPTPPQQQAWTAYKPLTRQRDKKTENS